MSLLSQPVPQDNLTIAGYTFTRMTALKRLLATVDGAGVNSTMIDLDSYASYVVPAGKTLYLRAAKFNITSAGAVSDFLQFVTATATLGLAQAGAFTGLVGLYTPYFSTATVVNGIEQPVNIVVAQNLYPGMRSTNGTAMKVTGYFYGYEA